MRMVAALVAGFSLLLAQGSAYAQPGETPETAPAPAPAPTTTTTPAPPPPPAAPPQPAPPPPPAAVPASSAPTGPRDIIITSSGSRSRSTDILLASLAGAAVIAGGIGVYFNLDAKNAADSVTATTPTGLPWTTARQQEVQHAHDSSVAAGVCYGIGGALVVGAVVGLILTVPPSEQSVIHPRMVRAVPTVAPTSGGAVVGGAWRF